MKADAEFLVIPNCDMERTQQRQLLSCSNFKTDTNCNSVLMELVMDSQEQLLLLLLLLLLLFQKANVTMTKKIILDVPALVTGPAALP
jgi:hypothetical protein